MLAWYENVPVVSYLVLRGKCRSCGAPISLMYPMIEVITGAMFLAGYLLVRAERAPARQADCSAAR